jgi:succinate dehydrogenase cytochrome b subunit
MRDVIRKYGGPFSGMLAQVIQRVTGLLLLAYLFLHVRTIYALSEGPAAFDRAVAEFRGPVFKLLEIALLGVVILHALNGVRITLIDLGAGLAKQRRLFWIWTIGAGAVIFLAGAIPLFLSSVLGR